MGERFLLAVGEDFATLRYMTPKLFESFQYCPMCGSANLSLGALQRKCGDCGHAMFNNPIAAVAVWIFDADNRVLLIERGREPAKGKLAPPGGFLDAGESLEVAAKREIEEEVGLKIKDLQFVCSHPNDYLYGGKTCSTCDVFFTAQLAEPAGNGVAQEGEVTAMSWRALADISRDDLAFVSMRVALDKLRGL